MSKQGENTGGKGWRERASRALARVRGASAKRAWLAPAGAVVAVVIVFGVLPGYFASQPSFLGKFSNMEGQYETWQTSVHAKVTCRQCHVRPAITSQTAFSARMLGEYYVRLVTRSRQPAVMKTPTNDACTECHFDLRTVSPSGDLRIPHTAHVDVLGLDCVKCHEFLVHEESPEGDHKPRMLACMECHDGVQAKNACTTCHTEKAAPDSHQADDWLVVHPDKQDELDCESCHGWTEHYCAECHSRRPKSHKGAWRTNHPQRVEQHRNCEVCHEGEFCIRCHGEVPTLNFDPAMELVQ